MTTSTAKRNFTLTAVHLAMLCALSITWSDKAFNGGPEVDKRHPFGDDDFVGIIAPALGIAQLEAEGGKKLWPAGTKDRCIAAYRETAEALQVVLSAKSFVAGEYVCEENSTRWRLLRAAS